MSFPGYSLPGYNRSAGQGDSAELEALQTDIMRFFAIIALCLAAIFSLVQSVSVAAPAPPLPLINAEQLQRRIDALIQRKDALAEELETLEDRLQQTHRITRRAEHRLTETSDSVNQVSQTLEQLRRQVAASGDRLRRLKTETDAQKSTLASIQRKVVTERYQLNRMEDSAQRVVESTAVKPPDTDRKSPESAGPPAAESDRGLSLGFASPDALRRLIAAGKVVFFARSGGRFWRLNGIAPAAYVSAKAPRAYYEMVGVTIPADFVNAYYKRVVDGANQVSWGVTLDAGIRRQLDAIVSRARQGEIIIHADGRVKLSAEAGG